MTTLIFGLDIGIASVGWAVLSEKRIVDMGVRCFDKAEVANTGESLNLVRRQARLARRRLYRRAWRLTKLARLLRREGLIADARLFQKMHAFAEPDPDRPGEQRLISTWQLRVDGLDRLLTPQQWARVLYHLCKHRGFHWISKAEEAQAGSDAEGGKVKQGLKNTKTLMQEKRYRSAAQMVLAEFPEAQRNKQGHYDKSLSRVLLGQELALLFAAQRRLGNPYTSESLEREILGTGDRRSGLFWQQKPALAGEDLLKMLGHCTFEKAEWRAPKASFSAERHMLLTRINNLRLIENGQRRALRPAEREIALLQPYETQIVKYASLKNKLKKAGLIGDDVSFAGLRYPPQAQLDAGKVKNPEEQTLLKLSAWHEMAKAFKKAGREDLWQRISTPALDGNPVLLDAVAWVLSVYKDELEVREQLERLDLPEPDACMPILERLSFEKFSNLSLKALHRIVPLMQQGLRYDEAVAKIPEYGHHSVRIDLKGAKHRLLPPFYENARKYSSKLDRTGSMRLRDDLDLPRNPVVLRALNQARKVVNALIREYGSPTAVHIEMARDLSRAKVERDKVSKLQDEYRERNETLRSTFEENFGATPQGAQFRKWRLYEEQGGKCAYSLAPLDIQRLIRDPNYAQIDHALPYSRSYDDGKDNQVLVLTRENQNKGNRTPYEYLTALDGGQEGERWHTFAIWVQGNKNFRRKKQYKLLRKHYGEDEQAELSERNLNDTRYICRFFKNYVEQNLVLAPRQGGDLNRRCVVLSGRITSFLRMHWGLRKVRDESDRHHALDAAVIAACTHGMVKRLADYSRRREIEYLEAGVPDPETGEITNPTARDEADRHFPEPWLHFRSELMARLYLDDPDALHSEIKRLGTYNDQDLQQLRPLFVSRAPQRRSSGAAHKDTIYAQPAAFKAQGSVIEKMKLANLKLAQFDKWLDADRGDHLIDPHRNQRLYQAIRQRLQQFGGDGKKAFGPDRPFHKPDRNDAPTGPVVRSVKLVRNKQSGIPIRGGLAKNDTMLRVDVFTKVGRFHLVPVYVHHRVTGLPDRAIVAYEDEAHWTLMDDSFEFLFSVHPNDFVRVRLRKESHEGYYSGADRSTGAISIRTHDGASSVGNKGLIRGIGVKTAVSFEKFNVDVLGRIYPARRERRRGLA